MILSLIGSFARSKTLMFTVVKHSKFSKARELERSHYIRYAFSSEISMKTDPLFLLDPSSRNGGILSDGHWIVAYRHQSRAPAMRRRKRIITKLCLTKNIFIHTSHCQQGWCQWMTNTYVYFSP